MAKSVMDTSLPLEIIVRIFDFLPGSCLKVCRCVCRYWKEASDIVLSKKGRQSLQAASFIGQLKSPSFLTAVKSFLHYTPLAIDTIVVFTQTLKSTQGDKRACQILQDAVKCAFQEYQSDRTVLRMVGCVAKFVFGPLLNNWEDLVNTCDIASDIPNTISLLLFPKLDSYSINTFHIPMKKKYEMIKGYASFFPAVPLRVSLVLLFIHPVTLGRMTHVVKAVRKTYGPKTCIIGLYAENFLFNQDTITSNEIIGMVLSGELACFSTVINDGVMNENIKVHVDAFCNRIEESVTYKHHTMLTLIFACNSFGNVRSLNILAQLRRRFPSGLLFGAYSPSVFGADYDINDSFRLPGGRDYLQTKGAILCSFLIKRSAAS